MMKAAMTYASLLGMPKIAKQKSHLDIETTVLLTNWSFVRQLSPIRKVMQMLYVYYTASFDIILSLKLPVARHYNHTIGLLCENQIFIQVKSVIETFYVNDTLDCQDLSGIKYLKIFWIFYTRIWTMIKNYQT